MNVFVEDVSFTTLCVSVLASTNDFKYYIEFLLFLDGVRKNV